MFRTVKRAVAVGAVTVIIGGAGVAWAAWTATGSGDAAAKAGEQVELTTVATTAGVLLYPGTTGEVRIRVRNDNPFDVNLTTILTTSGEAASGTPGCSPTGVTFTLPYLITGNGTVAKDSEREFVFSGAAHMSNDSVDSCQGATFELPVTLVGSST